ncbi:MAG: hypothetical protein ACTSRG_21750 [Candidatus Helarchaeota archaeon]
MLEGRYLCSQCYKQLAISFWKLKPSTIGGFNCEDIFPDCIIEAMPDYLIKDLNETFRCLEHQLWTATILMSVRIYESELKTHIIDDLGASEEEAANIGRCIKYMERYSDYPRKFLDILDGLRKLRNDSIHGATRYSLKESLETFSEKTY